MKTIENYLDELKAKLGSDYAIAKELGITKQSVSVIRKGGGVKDETAYKMAKLLGIDELEVMLAARAASTDGEIKEKWLNASKRLGIAASIALVAMLGNGFSGEAKASELDITNFTGYTLCEVTELMLITPGAEDCYKPYMVYVLSMTLRMLSSADLV